MAARISVSSSTAHRLVLGVWRNVDWVTGPSDDLTKRRSRSSDVRWLLCRHRLRGFPAPCINSISALHKNNTVLYYKDYNAPTDSNLCPQTAQNNKTENRKSRLLRGTNSSIKFRPRPTSRCKINATLNRFKWKETVSLKGQETADWLLYKLCLPPNYNRTFKLDEMKFASHYRFKVAVFFKSIRSLQFDKK